MSGGRGTSRAAVNGSVPVTGSGTYSAGMAQRRSRFGQALGRIVASQSQVHAESEQQHAARLGGTPVAELPLRRPVVVCGTLRSVTLRPRAGVPALEAELYDGTGRLSLVWLGRRQIAGIEPGRRVRVRGLVANVDGERTVYNPKYELVPRGHE